MTSGKIAICCAGGALLVAYLAAANMPGSDTTTPRARAPTAATRGRDSVASEVQAQAVRLRERMAQAPAPDPNPRNPFSFGATPRPRAAAGVQAAVVDQVPAVPVVPTPSLTLMGIAEESLPQGVRRTAVIGGDADTLYMVTEGDAVGERYKVTKIGADAVELEDLLTKAYRRLALR